MKIFKKLLLLKWHYIEHECIDFGKVNFLTGKNGSGKSTLIDAMQVILLGDTSGSFFNKAANKRSQRTLLSYAKGELTDNDEAGFNYLRNDDFTSIIAMEVNDDSKKKSFTIGIQIDVATDNSVNHKFFILEGKIPSHHFIVGDVVMDISEMKAFVLKNNLKLEQFATNKSYRESLLGKLGNVNQKYFSLFKKAVPFSPITDIKGFITEFICDTDKKVDIRNMQDNIRYYEKMKLEAEDIEKRTTKLEEIQVAYKEHKRLEELEILQNFLVDQGKKELAKEEIDKLNKTLAEGKKQHIAKEQEIEIQERKLNAIREEREAIQLELIKSDVYSREQEYKRNIEKLTNNIKAIEADKERIVNTLRKRGGAWQYYCKALDRSLEGEHLTSILLHIDKMDHTLKEDELDSIETASLIQLDEWMKEQIQYWNGLRFQLTNQLQELRNIISDIEADIKKLESGKKAVEKRVELLQGLIQSKLSERHGTSIQVHMVCDLMELKDPKWQNAIEGYLHFQKFYLFVEPEYFVEALEIYDVIKDEHHIYDVGLVDMEKIVQRGQRAKEGSLAEEIETNNTYVSSYMDYLLGSVMKVESVSDLRNHEISITPTCMLYKNYVARQLNPNRYSVPYIGSTAVKCQLEMKKEQLVHSISREKTLASRCDGMNILKNLVSLGEDVLDEWQRRLKDFKLLPSEKELLKDWKDKLGKLDCSNIIELNMKLKELDDLIKNKEILIRELYGQTQLIASQTENIEKVQLKSAEIGLAEKEEMIRSKYTVEWISQHGVPRFEGELKRLQSVYKIVQNFESAVKAILRSKEKKWDEVLLIRGDYIREFQGTYSVHDQSNQEYDKLLTQLRETELPTYKEKINDAIEIAQQEFRDDFLSKLKYNIDVVREQIKELNEALKNMSFGQDAYAFKMTPNSYYRKYYDMITDPNLLEDINIFSFSFQEKYGDVINELFKKIVDVGEGAISADERVQIEENIAKYTDYRTYLDFDLVVTDDRGNKSHLSKMISKKSGGETQTPFYISVLASFFRVYRMNVKSRDTSRLIIFDEAFSKMDHERIRVCIELLKDLGFQALISAPSEKIANITPLVDKTLCVLRTKTATVVKAFTKEELENV